LKIPRSRFKASKEWAIRFMPWKGLALRRRTTICQKLPKHFEKKVVELSAVHHQSEEDGNFLMGQMSNADETAIYLDMPLNYTLEKKGVKEVF